MSKRVILILKFKIVLIYRISDYIGILLFLICFLCFWRWHYFLPTLKSLNKNEKYVLLINEKEKYYNVELPIKKNVKLLLITMVKEVLIDIIFMLPILIVDFVLMLYKKKKLFKI